MRRSFHSAVLIIILFSSCAKSDLGKSKWEMLEMEAKECPIPSPKLFIGKMRDVDGNIYNTVRVGEQIWMAEDLRVTRFRTGDPIPVVMPDQEWINIKTDAWCNIFNDITKDSSYGKIYNGYTIKDRRGLAPKGWHISTAKDWEVLLKTYDGSVEKLKSISVWSNYPGGLNGTNESGLNLAPGGFRSSETGFFMNFGKCGDYWTKTVASTDEVVFERIVGENQNLHTLPGKLNLGLYVRCVKD